MIDCLVVSRDSQIGAQIIKRLNGVGTTRRDHGDKLYFDLRGHAPLPPAKLTFFCSGINGFKQCAADPMAAYNVNVEGTVRAANWQVEQGGRVVLLSSCAAETHPYTVYGAYKLQTEKGFLEFGDRASIFRFGPVKFPGRVVYSNHDYHPIEVDDLITAVTHQFMPGLHAVYNTPKAA